MKKKRLIKYISRYQKKLRTFLRKVRRNFTMFLTYSQNIALRFLALVKTLFYHHKKIITKALIPVVIVGGGVYACTSQQRAILEDVSQIFSLSDEIRAYYADKPDYWGVDTDLLIKNKVLPKHYIHKNKLLLDSGRQILIGNGINAEPVMPLAQTFDIIMPDLNKAQCISYAEAPLDDEASLKLFSLQIINSSGAYLFEWGGSFSLPIKKYATKDLCLDRENTLIWSIK